MRPEPNKIDEKNAENTQTQNPTPTPNHSKFVPLTSLTSLQIYFTTFLKLNPSPLFLSLSLSLYLFLSQLYICSFISHLISSRVCLCSC